MWVCLKPKAVLQYDYSTEHPSISAVCGFRNWKTAMTAFTAMKQCQFTEMRIVHLKKKTPFIVALQLLHYFVLMQRCAKSIK